MIVALMMQHSFDLVIKEGLRVYGDIGCWDATMVTNMLCLLSWDDLDENNEDLQC